MDRMLRELLLERGASLVGYADLSPLPGSASRGYRRGVSIGIALQKSVVREIPTGPHRDYEVEYNEVNARLDRLGLFAESWLREQGEEAWAVTVERAPYTREECRTPLPHKTAARLAGHGWIGRNALLVTPEFGSAVRFTTVLTGAPLPANEKLHPNRCGSCRRCVEACPGKAISGTAWEEEADRDQLVSTEACQETFRIRRQLSGQRDGTCGLCLAACPYAMRYASKQEGAPPDKMPETYG